jgi:hypothetical protein
MCCHTQKSQFKKINFLEIIYVFVQSKVYLKVVVDIKNKTTHLAQPRG